MRKLYTLLALFALALGAKAQISDPDAVVANFENYAVQSNFDLKNWTVNGEAIGTWGAESTAASFKVNSAAVYQITATGMTNWYCQVVAQVYQRSGYGLFNFGSGGRAMAVADMHEGQIVVISGGYTDASRPFDTNTYGVDATVAEEITEEVHAAQEEAAEGSADTYRYFKMLADGRFDFVLGRSNFLSGLVILKDMTSAEYVTAPAGQITGVNGTQRSVTVTEGASSLDYSVTTWYSVDGSDPVYLQDTDVIATADTIWNEDGTYELDNIVYVQQAVEQDGAWGELQYDGDAIRVDENDDEDGDGIVVVKMCTISETGIASSIVTMNVEVSEIQLNEPTLTLVGMNGTKRGYVLGWTSNIIEKDKEPSFTVEFDDGEDDSYVPGDTIWASDYIIVNVSADGYTSNSTELQELAEEGTDYQRANTEKAHDWDFQNFDEDVRAKLTQSIIDYYYTVSEDGDTITYSEEEAPVDAIEHYAYFGWTMDAVSSKNRTWRDITTDTLTVENEDGTVTTTVTATYVEESSGLLDGLNITCDPTLYSSGAYGGSYYVGTAQQGMYNTKVMTIEIPSVKYGEFVVYGYYGGVTCVECTNPDGGITITIPRMSYLYYIDVYTSDNLPDSIEQVQQSGRIANGAIYDLMGRRVAQPTHPGIYIQNGKKFLVK